VQQKIEGLQNPGQIGKPRLPSKDKHSRKGGKGEGGKENRPMQASPLAAKKRRKGWAAESCGREIHKRPMGGKFSEAVFYSSPDLNGEKVK